MWGNIITESYLNLIFNFTFLNNKSDIILHLTQWQYWFWFWFTYFIVLYYLLFLKLIRSRMFSTNPKIVTSFRAHGKWGDFIVCILPLSWCLNILSNSNFILRMIEWQSESTFLSIRVRGKQWYWIYKFEINNVNRLHNPVKNIGHNFWTQSKSSNLNLFHLNLKKKYQKDNFLYKIGAIDSISTTKDKYFSSNPSKQVNGVIDLRNEIVCVPTVNINKVFKGGEFYRLNNLTSTFVGWSDKQFWSESANNIKNQNLVSNTSKSQHNLKLFFLKKNNTNIALIFNTSHFKKKFFQNNIYFVIKQKRFLEPLSSRSSTVNLNSVFSQNKDYFYLNNKLSKNLNLITNKRLLRTKRVLVLPTYLNIAVITNSFDVIHSWFIPGLGIKLDCVPGRSTHHNIYLDYSGFYYGQCAEICGRYHHHMPIRICALSFEHFLTWWYHYGFINLNFTKNSHQIAKNNANMFTW